MPRRVGLLSALALASLVACGSSGGTGDNGDNGETDGGDAAAMAGDSAVPRDSGRGDATGGADASIDSGAPRDSGAGDSGSGTDSGVSADSGSPEEDAGDGGGTTPGDAGEDGPAPGDGGTIADTGVVEAAADAGTSCPAGSCDDGNPCTADSCTGDGGCEHTVSVGASCDDGIACTTGDVCTAQGSCTGTVTASCAAGGSCSTTASLGGTIDIGVAQTSATITLAGSVLPATNEYGTDVALYMVAHDTGQWHTFATWSYNSNLFGPTVTPRLVPGVYDVLYCHGCSTATGGISPETDATDAFPEGLRMLQTDLVVGAGPNALAIDIPVASVSATITLGGAALPATNEYGTDVALYLVSHDTQQWHTLATWSYNSSLYGPTVTPRVVPGVYDVYYCHGCSTAPGGISPETDATDAFPEGLRVLQSGITLASGANHLAIDIPVSTTSAAITLGGGALPATNEYGTDVALYLVAHDTGQWHTFATWSYNSSLYGPTVTPRLIPGVYDVWYCHGCSTATGGIAPETDATDAFPEGLRVLKSNVTVPSGAFQLPVDIPVAQTTATVTLGGSALPATNEYGTDVALYAVAHDTGQWHTLATWSYNSSLYGPTATPRLVPGVYDVWYCHGCSTATGGISPETDATDAFPEGLRVLQSNVNVTSGSFHFAVDVPVAQISATFTLGGASLPGTNEYGTDVAVYAVARDTRQWHTLATWSYNSSLYGPTVTPRLVPGVYDLWYCHGCSTATGGISPETDATDAYPEGLRVLQSGVTLAAGADHLAIDIPVTPISETITLAGKPLPATNEYGTDVALYLVARDTAQWHTLATWSYNSNLYGPTVTPRVVPGTYDVWYCHGCSTATGGISPETDATDAFPEGLRALEACVTVP